MVVSCLSSTSHAQTPAAVAPDEPSTHAAPPPSRVSKRSSPLRKFVGSTFRRTNARKPVKGGYDEQPAQRAATAAHAERTSDREDGAGAASDGSAELPSDKPGSGSNDKGVTRDVEDLLFRDLPAPVVLSATKVEQPIYGAPSAITVITAEDIRRMGARRLVDVFRWAPGLDVFAQTGNMSSISARGFYAPRPEVVNEMLVLIDGRSVYVDFLGGVQWDTLPVLLEEIDRIEIIRGPSGSLYGPNAAVGTISVFTKRKPEPTISRTTVGNQHFFESNVIHWLDGENYDIRLGIGWLEHEGYGGDRGRAFRDDVNFLRMNMFSHFQLDPDNSLEWRMGWLTGARSFNGFFFDGSGTEDTDFPYGQVDFEHRFSDDVRFRARYFHNHFDFDRLFGNGSRDLETWTDAVTLEQYWRVHRRHQLIFGGEFRNFVAHSGLTEHERVEENVRSLFIEDDIALMEKSLHLILGLRYDDFTESGDDFSPRTALVWRPVPQHSFRASLARAISTPASVQSHLDFRRQVATVNLGPGLQNVPILVHAMPNHELNPESFMAYELGYRGRWTKNLDWVWTCFCTTWQTLSAAAPSPPLSIPAFRRSSRAQRWSTTPIPWLMEGNSAFITVGARS